MKVHLFGLPISLHRRLKGESSNWTNAVPDGHEFRATPIESNEKGPFKQTEISELFRGVREGFTHIVIPANRNWDAIRKGLQFDCRIHLARLRQPLRDLTWEILKTALHDTAAMDEEWLAKFCPKDLRHPASYIRDIPRDCRILAPLRYVLCGAVPGCRTALGGRRSTSPAS